MLLRSLARNVATMATAQTIKADVEANDMTISEKRLRAISTPCAGYS